MPNINNRDNNIHAYNFMPKGNKEQEILAARATNLATKLDLDTIRVKSISYVRFKLSNNEYYGIPYQFAAEVMRNITLTRLPFVPNFVAGVINRHGTLLTVIDLNNLFHAKSLPFTANNSIIIVSIAGITLGILTEAIIESDAYENDELITTFPYQDQIKPEYILGLHKNVTAILDINTIIADVKLKLEYMSSMKKSPGRNK